MAFVGSRVTVANTATLISSPDAASASSKRNVIVTNKGGQSIDLGGSGVLTGAGLALAPGESLSMSLGRGDDLYGITAASTCVVHVLTNRGQ